MKDPAWTKYGFQNGNPRTDFRGAGILGVKNLTYFAQNYPEQVRLMSQTPLFFMALHSIQISVCFIILDLLPQHFLIVHLHLVKNEASLMPNMIQYKASRHQLKHFLSLAASRQQLALFDPENAPQEDSPIDMLNELHSQALIFLHHYQQKLAHSHHKTNAQQLKGAAFVKHQQAIGKEPIESTFKFVCNLTAHTLQSRADIRSFAEYTSQQILMNRFKTQ